MSKEKVEKKIEVKTGTDKSSQFERLVSQKRCQICHKKVENLYCYYYETPIRKLLRAKIICEKCMTTNKIQRGYKFIDGLWCHPADLPVNRYCTPGIDGLPYFG